ncbi:hypothetical protein ABDM40_28335, partial [Klebsiella pneumoniae]
MMSLWDALRMNMMISYQELVRTFPKRNQKKQHYQYINFIDFNVSLHCFGTAPHQNKKGRCADRKYTSM